MDFVSTLLDLFETRRDKLLYMLRNGCSFGKAVRRTFRIGKSYYVTIAIRFFPINLVTTALLSLNQPLVCDEFTLFSVEEKVEKYDTIPVVRVKRDELKYVLAVLDHLSTIGIYKYDDKYSFCAFYDSAQRRNRIWFRDHAVANKLHNRFVRKDLKMVSDIIMLADLSVKCEDVMLKLNGGGKKKKKQKEQDIDAFILWYKNIGTIVPLTEVSHAEVLRNGDNANYRRLSRLPIFFSLLHGLCYEYIFFPRESVWEKNSLVLHHSKSLIRPYVYYKRLNFRLDWHTSVKRQNRVRIVFKVEDRVVMECEHNFVGDLLVYDSFDVERAIGSLFRYKGLSCLTPKVQIIFDSYDPGYMRLDVQYDLLYAEMAANSDLDMIQTNTVLIGKKNPFDPFRIRSVIDDHIGLENMNSLFVSEIPLYMIDRDEEEHNQVDDEEGCDEILIYQVRKEDDAV